jgi:hypothetical protein
MKSACPIPLSDLGNWVRDAATRWPELPIYRLASPSDLLASDAVIGSLREVGLTAQRRRDSGTIEGRTLSTDHSLNATSDFVRTIVRAGAAEDERTYSTDFEDPYSGDLGSARQFASYRSRIKLGDRPNDLDVSVIGPGGGISLFRTETSVRVDITVRKRLEKLPSRWRAFRHIYRSYEREFVQWKEQIEVEPMFGYFELSKYEAQPFLRPAFVFIFHMPGNDDSVAWQTVRVEPATSLKNLSLRAGLGQWQSSGGIR